jgi:hypothetical protein
LRVFFATGGQFIRKGLAMTKTAQLISITAAALMLGAAIPAQALDVSIGGASVSAGSGGSDGGGTSASVGSGDTSVNATIGGGSNVADVGVGSGDTSVNANIANTDGNLVDLNSEGGTTNGNVNLGGLGLGSTPNDTVNGVTDPLGDLLDGIDVGDLTGGGGGAGGGGGGGGGGGVTAPGLVSAYGGLSASDQRTLRVRCASVLNNRSSYNANTVALCTLIARL